MLSLKLTFGNPEGGAQTRGHLNFAKILQSILFIWHLLEAYFVHPSEMFSPPWEWLFGRRLWTKDISAASEESDAVETK